VRASALYTPGMASSSLPILVVDRSVSTLDALECLTRYPAAASAARLDEASIAAFCREMGYSGKRPPAALLGRPRSAPTRNCGDTLTAAVGDDVLALVAVVKAVTAATRELDRPVTLYSFPW
jgi:hypothetical protein